MANILHHGYQYLHTFIVMHIMRIIVGIICLIMLLYRGISKNLPPIILLRLFPPLCVNFPCKTDVFLRKIALIGEKIPINLIDAKFLEMPRGKSNTEAAV